MKPYHLLSCLSFCFLLLNCVSCLNYVPPANCDTLLPQKHKFGHLPLDVRTRAGVLTVGDTLHMRMKVSQQVYDSLSKQPFKVNGKLSLIVWLTTANYPNANDSFFATPETIFSTFDQYFRIILVKGKQKSVYEFDCELIDGFWQLEVHYIALRKGSYTLDAMLTELTTGEVDEGVCTVGPRFYGADVELNTLNNQINRLYPTNKPVWLDPFGFVIE